MKIVAISDTHGTFPVLPDGDVLVHAGDGTMMGTTKQITELEDWFSTLNFKSIIFVPGNHDFICETGYVVKNCTMLLDSGIDIDGVNFWGSPYSPKFGSWAFMKPDFQLTDVWNKIPNDTDVLITHCPPFDILDKTVRGINTGSYTLRYAIKNRVDAKYHIFGHIHESYGVCCKDNVIYVNASVVNINYNNTNKPTVINL